MFNQNNYECFKKKFKLQFKTLLTLNKTAPLFLITCHNLICEIKETTLKILIFTHVFSHNTAVILNENNTKHFLYTISHYI